MSFIFKCPYCGQKLRAQDDWIGRRGKCTSCNSAITIQASDGSTSSYSHEFDQRYKECVYQQSIVSIIYKRLLEKITLICRSCQKAMQNLKRLKASKLIVQQYKIIIAVLCVGIIFLAWRAHTSDPFKDPKAVAQMAIDSIMNEDYQLYLDINTPTLLTWLRESSGHKKSEDPTRDYFFNYYMRKKQQNFLIDFPKSLRTINRRICEVECKTINIELDGNSDLEEYENGKRRLRFPTKITYKILNYIPSPKYSGLRLPEFGESKDSVWVEQQSDGRWKVCIWITPLPYNGVHNLVQNAALQQGY